MKASSHIRPFLKWAGRKHRVLGRILPHLPAGGRLIEPFVGSGAVFLNGGYASNLVNDINRDLMTLYQILKHDADHFIAEATPLFVPDNNQAERFYQLRERFNLSSDPLERSILFFYLNRHGFNGLCRYNKKGGFNVPFGRYTNPGMQRESLDHFIEVAQRTEFVCEDFATVMERAEAGDVVYCDPPYVPLSDTAYFTCYAQDGFSMEQQQQLADVAASLVQRGVTVVISNHDTPVTRRLYQQADLELLDVQRHISAKLEGRGTVAELMALYRPD